MTRAFALAAMAALLAGCTATSGSGPVAYYGVPPAGPAGQLARPVSTGQALVRLPASAGTVLTVVERRSGEVVAQEITLKADASALGENMVRVAIGRLNDGDPVLAPKVAPARASDIELEMAEAFPRVTMRIAETVSRNAYGPFGYATGTYGRHTCLYAWQFIPKIGEGSGPLPGVLAVPRSAALRVRLCRARVPAEDLIAAVEAMSMIVPARGEVYYPVTAPAGADALDSVYPVY